MKTNKIISDKISYNHLSVAIPAIVGAMFFIIAVIWNFAINMPWDYTNNYCPTIEQYKALGYSTATSTYESYLWWGFMQYFTTQSNIIVFLVLCVAIVGFIFKKSIFKSFFIFDTTAAYITITAGIFCFVLLPFFLIELLNPNVQTGNTGVSVWRYLPQSILLHMFCPLSYLIFFFNLNLGNQNIKRSISYKKYIYCSLLYPCLYIGYVLLINFVKFDGLYHTVYANITNYNSSFVYAIALDAPKKPGSTGYLVLLPIMLFLFFVLLNVYLKSNRLLKEVAWVTSFGDKEYLAIIRKYNKK